MKSFLLCLHIIWTCFALHCQSSSLPCEARLTMCDLKQINNALQRCLGVQCRRIGSICKKLWMASFDLATKDHQKIDLSVVRLFSLRKSFASRFFFLLRSSGSSSHPPNRTVKAQLAPRRLRIEQSVVRSLARPGLTGAKPNSENVLCPNSTPKKYRI